jgi:hypothetical protein
LLGQHAGALDQSPSFAVGVDVNHEMGIAAATEKTLQPAPPSAISPTRRKMSARITTSPTSADPIIKARKWAASNGKAVQPCGPARPPAIDGRPASWFTSPLNWPILWVTIGA